MLWKNRQNGSLFLLMKVWVMLQCAIDVPVVAFRINSKLIWNCPSVNDRLSQTESNQKEQAFEFSWLPDTRSLSKIPPRLRFIIDEFLRCRVHYRPNDKQWFFRDNLVKRLLNWIDSIDNYGSMQQFWKPTFWKLQEKSFRLLLES